jgi:hypothetical protein
MPTSIPVDRLVCELVVMMRPVSGLIAVRDAVAAGPERAG